MSADSERRRLADALGMDPRYSMAGVEVRARAADRGVDLTTFDTPVARHAAGIYQTHRGVPVPAADPAPPVADPVPAGKAPRRSVVARKLIAAPIRPVEPLPTPAPPAPAPAAPTGASATGLSADARAALVQDGAKYRWGLASAARAASAAANGGLASPELCAAAARAMDEYCQTLVPAGRRGGRKGR